MALARELGPRLHGVDASVLRIDMLGFKLCMLALHWVLEPKALLDIRCPPGGL